jgi:hypothetical protein
MCEVRRDFGGGRRASRKQRCIGEKVCDKWQTSMRWVSLWGKLGISKKGIEENVEVLGGRIVRTIMHDREPDIDPYDKTNAV